MREILFRGKRFDNNEWIEGGFYLEPYTDNAYIVAWNSMGMGFIEYILVCKETVGQYTGLKDKNGVRIFEGDVIDCWSEGVNAKGTVQQRKDGLWIIYPAWQKVIMWSLCPDEYCNTTVEVIGNIHDNPELLAEVEG